MNNFADTVAIISWFVGGVFLGAIEIIALPVDPNYSTLLQILPLLFLVGGIGFIFSNYQATMRQNDRMGIRLRIIMTVGWIALFGVDAGVASISNVATQIFHTSLPFYYQGVSLSQKIIALGGVFGLGGASLLAWRRLPTIPSDQDRPSRRDFWEQPLRSLGFVAVSLGVVLGLAQYWYPVIFASFILMVGGAILLLVGTLTEKSSRESE